MASKISFIVILVVTVIGTKSRLRELTTPKSELGELRAKNLTSLREMVAQDEDSLELPDSEIDDTTVKIYNKLRWIELGIAGITGFALIQGVGYHNLEGDQRKTVGLLAVIFILFQVFRMTRDMVFCNVSYAKKQYYIETLQVRTEKLANVLETSCYIYALILVFKAM